jgi:hypothetical protein
MKITDAQAAVSAAIAQMNTLYRQPLFDEWIIVQLAAAQGTILAYAGPRSETYQKRFTADLAPLRDQLITRKLAVGDFEFVQTGKGTHFDACVRLGPAAYLFCNHTTKPMAEIRQDPHWLDAQKAFVALASRFRADPLE